MMDQKNIGGDFQSKEDHDTMIEDCQNRSDQLSEWETDFIDNLTRQNAPLTSRQAYSLEQIWDRVTDAGLSRI